MPARRPLYALLLGSLVASGLLALAEAKLRYDERFLRYMWDSGRRYSTRPGVAGADAFGFLERGLPRASAPDVRRIVVIGDSVTWGPGRAEEAYPRLVEAALGPPWQVLNLSHYGYDTQQCAAVLREYGWDYGPEVVVYASYTNDPIPTRAIAVNGGHVWVAEQGLLPLALRRSSALLRRLEGALLLRTLTEQPEWDTYRAAVVDLRDQAAAHAVPLLVLGLVPHILAEPTLAGCSEHLGKPGHCEAHAAIAMEQEAIARALGLRYLSALPALRASGAADYYPADVTDWQHPGSAGHALYARVLLELLAPHTSVEAPRTPADDTEGR